jgi:probable rRNA maturation factor
MPLRFVTTHNAHPRLRFDRRAVAGAIHVLDERFGQSKIKNPKSKIPPVCPPGELSLAFLTDTALAKLHADFLDDPAPTDVITFAGDPAHGQAGEICISVDAALRQLSAGSPVRERMESFSAELTLYLVHGWLHLAGYDDLAPAKKRAMRRAEARAMKLLRVAGVLPQFVLRRA